MMGLRELRELADAAPSVYGIERKTRDARLAAAVPALLDALEDKDETIAQARVLLAMWMNARDTDTVPPWARTALWDGWPPPEPGTDYTQFLPVESFGVPEETPK